LPVEYTDAASCADPSNGGLLLPQYESWMLLYPDGTFTVWQPDNPDPAYHGVIGVSGGVTLPYPVSGVVALDGAEQDGDIHVEGTLNGRLTILAGRRIYADGDILFADDPRVSRSRDKLGLLAGWMNASEGHLVISDIVPDGPDGDRLIFGNYIGRGANSGLLVPDYPSRDYEGVIFLYGSVFQGKLRSTMTSDGLHGYATDFFLDPRTCVSPPPCFPSLSWGE
jgi:hypothetical protein